MDMLSNEQHLADMGRKGRRHASDFYSWEYIGSSMERFYREVVNA